MSVLYPKKRDIFWTCVKDNIIKKKDQCKAIVLHGFGSKLFEEEEGGGFQ